jgi:hypothetical protein
LRSIWSAADAFNEEMKKDGRAISISILAGYSPFGIHVEPPAVGAL